MAKADARFLDANDAFPEMEFRTISGEKLRLPQDAGKGYGVLLLYRGHW